MKAEHEDASASWCARRPYYLIVILQLSSQFKTKSLFWGCI